MKAMSPNKLDDSRLSSTKWRSDADFSTFKTRCGIAAYMLEKGYDAEAERFCNCGRRIHQFESERLRLLFGIRERCRSRICDRCAEFAFKAFRLQVLTILDGLPQDRKKQVGFLTLTFKKRELSTAYIRKCTKDVRKFVNIFYGKWFHKYNPETGRFTKTKSRQDCGGVAVMEIGKSGNLHFHLLVYGYFHPLKFMSKIWLAITGDSYRIDIQNVSHSTKSSPGRAAGYVLKYIRKPPFFDDVSGYLDYWLLLKGLRRIHTYGVFYGHEVWKKEKRPLLCPFCGDKLVYRGYVNPGAFVLDYRYHSQGLSPPEDGSVLSDKDIHSNEWLLIEYYRFQLEYCQKLYAASLPLDINLPRRGCLRSSAFSLDKLWKTSLS